MKHPILLKAGRGHLPTNPLTSDLDIALVLQELCGAEGYTIEGNQLLALRWDLDGNPVVIERYEICPVSPS